MKTLAAVIFATICMGAFAQKSDLPPVIVVRMTPQESARLADVQKRVADAQAELQKAEGDEGEVRYEIMKAHRTKEIGTGPMCVSPMMLTNSGFVIDSFTVEKPTREETSYASRIEGDWIIFSHDIPYCKGA